MSDIDFSTHDRSDLQILMLSLDALKEHKRKREMIRKLIRIPEIVCLFHYRLEQTVNHGRRSLFARSIDRC